MAEAGTDLQCETCNQSEQLWLCLICGFLGCGRYKKQHSLEHNDAAGHNYAVELASGRIWSYYGDNYVHRIIKTSLEAHHEETQEQWYNRLAAQEMDVNQLQMQKKSSGLSDGKNTSAGKMV